MRSRTSSRTGCYPGRGPRKPSCGPSSGPCVDPAVTRRRGRVVREWHPTLCVLATTGPVGSTPSASRAPPLSSSPLPKGPFGAPGAPACPAPPPGGVRASPGPCFDPSQAATVCPRGHSSRRRWAPTLDGLVAGFALLGGSVTRPPPSEVRELCAPASRRVCPFRSRLGIVIDRRHHAHAERSLRGWLSDIGERLNVNLRELAF